MDVLRAQRLGFGVRCASWGLSSRVGVIRYNLCYLSRYLLHALALMDGAQPHCISVAWEVASTRPDKADTLHDFV